MERVARSRLITGVERYGQCARQSAGTVGHDVRVPRRRGVQNVEVERSARALIVLLAEVNRAGRSVAQTGGHGGAGVVELVNCHRARPGDRARLHLEARASTETPPGQPGLSASLQEPAVHRDLTGVGGQQPVIVDGGVDFKRSRTG